MHFCRRGIIRKYDLIAFLNFSMLLVAVKSHHASLSSGIYILVHFLWGLSFTTYHPSLFYLLIFITGVTLARGNNKTGINDATLIELQTLTFHETMKFRKKLVINACICQEFAILPHRLLVRNIVNTFNTKKLAETRTVNYLILYQWSTQTIITLKKQEDLEHQHSLSADDRHYFCALGKKG